MIQPMTVSDLARDGAVMRATLQSGEIVSAPLLVGADGRRSFVRGWAGIRTIDRAYDATALVCTVAHEKPHGGVAHEYFLPSGPFAILPLTNDRANVVWVERPEATAALLRLTDDAFLAELMRRFGPFLGEVTLEGPRFSYPLALKLAEKMIAPRIALAGDSAHGIHPIAGQGLNQGLKDVAALAECVADAVALGLDAGDATALERYQRWRRFDNVAMAAATDMFDRLFSNDIAPLRFARDVGLSIVNRIGPARRYFMRTAGGASGDLPKLLRGESLAA
jgi:2-octaprenyl-6-methoxyphenol hydroxylase